MNILIDFKAYLQSRDQAQLTMQGYLSDISLFMRWFEQANRESFSLPAVTPTDIREYRQFLQVTEQRKASTVNRKLAAISALMKWAKSIGQISSDPTDGIKLVKQTPVAPKWLTKKELFALQRAIEKDLQVAKLRYPKRCVTRRRDASLTVFMLHTGLRVSELIQLQMCDVELSERKGSVLVRRGKGNKQRSVPLNAEARKAVQEWLEVRPSGSDPFLWISVEYEGAEGLTSRAIQRVLRRYGKDAGLDDLTPHILRHTFAKNLANQNVGLEKIAALMGHASLNTTRIYVAPDVHDLERAVEQLEK
jgi:integrase/recombinase XerC